jgi:hypothetical protein
MSICVHSCTAFSHSTLHQMSAHYRTYHWIFMHSIQHLHYSKCMFSDLLFINFSFQYRTEVQKSVKQEIYYIIRIE